MATTCNNLQQHTTNHHHHNTRNNTTYTKFQIMSTPKILLSRHALQTMKPKYPIHFTFPKKKFKTSAETPWPISLQIAGYTAAILAVPYTFSVIVSESRLIRDSLEGECKGRGSGSGESGDVQDQSNSEGVGRKIVSLVRWYWGTNDHIPYIEVLEQKEKEGSGIAYSLENEDNVGSRLNQDRIEKESNNSVKVVLESEDIVQDGVILKGNAPIAEQLFSAQHGDGKQFDKSKPIVVTIEDDDNTSTDDDELNTDIPSLDEDHSAKKEISNLSTIYAMWNYFPPSSPSTNQTISISSQSSSAGMNTIQIRIEELQHEISDLRKMMNDPMCVRDRDDMDQEMKNLRMEMNFLRREKRKANLKKLIPF